MTLICGYASIIFASKFYKQSDAKANQAIANTSMLTERTKKKCQASLSTQVESNKEFDTDGKNDIIYRNEQESPVGLQTFELDLR